jgi:hypothetical protein
MDADLAEERDGVFDAKRAKDPADDGGRPAPEITLVHAGWSHCSESRR